MTSEYGRDTALVVVDLQNDFGHPAGSLYVPEGEEVVPIANREIEQALAAEAFVVYTQDWHPPSTPHFEKDGGIWPVHCIANSWGAELISDLAVAGPVIQKGTDGEDGYSGFTGRDPGSESEHPTELAELLRKRGVSKLVVLGLATDYCVKETALDGVRLGFDSAVLAEGVRAVDLQPGDGERALDELRQAGVAIIVR